MKIRKKHEMQQARWRPIVAKLSKIINKTSGQIL